MALDERQVETYGRQLVLDGVGGAGQRRLLEATVVVTGAGPASASVVRALGMAGVGRVHIVGTGAARIVADCTPSFSDTRLTTANNGDTIPAQTQLAVAIAPHHSVRRALGSTARHRRIPLLIAALSARDCRLSGVAGERGTPCAECVPAPAGDSRPAPEAREAIASLTALEAIKLLVDRGRSMIGREVRYDPRTETFTERALSRRPDCPACAHDREETGG